MNCFPLRVEPNINVDLKGNRKHSNSNVPQAYKSELSHFKLSWISWSITTLIIFVLLIWPTVYIPHNNVLSPSDTIEMETYAEGFCGNGHSSSHRHIEVSPFLGTCKGIGYSTQMPFCNQVHQGKFYCLLILLSFCCLIFYFKVICAHYRKI